MGCIVCATRGGAASRAVQFRAIDYALERGLISQIAEPKVLEYPASIFFEKEKLPRRYVVSLRNGQLVFYCWVHPENHQPLTLGTIRWSNLPKQLKKTLVFPLKSSVQNQYNTALND